MPLTLDHRTRQRRQGGRRARAPARRAAARAAARGADGGRRRRTTSASSRPAGIVFGAEVLTFARLMREIAARRRRARRGRSGAVARERVVRAAIARRASCARWRASARGAGLRRRAAGALFAELQRSLVAPARFTRALRAWARRRRAGATPTSWRRCTPPTAGGWRRSGAVDARGLRAGRRSTRCAPRPARWGGRPVFLYGFDDLTPRAARRGRDARRATPTPRSASRCPTSPAAPRSPAARRRSSCCKPLADASTSRCEDRSEHYAARARGALHHLERGLFEAGAERARARTARCGCWRRAASAPRPSSSAPRCSS